MVGLRQVLLGSGAVAALFALSSSVNAGGFAVREQSAEFQGMSFAGNAASGGGLSGMFWNPAVAAYAPAGIYTEAHYSGIFGHVNVTGDTSVGGVSLGLPQNGGNIAKDAVVPSSYMSYRLSDRLVAALSINSPFGLVTEPSNRFWAGQTFARSSDIKTYNATPTLAYKLMPTVSIGLGLQIQHTEGTLKNATGITPNSLNAVVKGDDTSFGFTAGVNWTPSEHTSIGLGWRSSINNNLQGTISIPGSPLGALAGAGIQATFNQPDIVTLSARHQLTDRLTVLATGEWTNWSRLEKLDIVCADNPGGGNPVFCPAGNGQLVRSLFLGWHDSWMASIGAEYKYSHHLTLRTGFAYEKSPIQNAAERTLRVPDTDRLWTSLGATYKFSDKMAFDFAYSHIFGIGDDNIDRTEGGLRFVGRVDANVDIISASMKIKLGDAPVAYEPVK